MYEKLPQELKDHALFCGWKYQTRDGRRTKVPKTVTGRNAVISDPLDFCGFEEILKARDLDGIGIAVRDGLAAIDIDHSVVDGHLSDLAAAIVEKTRSYTEISPSGEASASSGRLKASPMTETGITSTTINLASKSTYPAERDSSSP